MTAAIFVILTFAAFRLSRLIVEDTIAAPVRDRINTYLLKRLWPEPDEDRKPSRAAAWLYDLLDCPWCVGVHVSFWLLVAAACTDVVDIHGDTPERLAAFLGLWLALAATQSIVYVVVNVLTGLAEALDDEEGE